MEQQTETLIPRVKLGRQGLEVSKLGFGCMGLTGAYNDPLPDEAGISIIKHAFNRGITFFDTSDVYGPHTNEILVGKALKQLPRENVQLATKFGIVGFSNNDRTVVRANGSPEYVRVSCEASLDRLGVEYIDLYYQHRVDKNVPIEDTASFPRFSVENLEKNKILYVRLQSLAAKYQCTPAQLALAWVLHQGEDVVPIPGTTKIKNLDDNIDSLKLKLTEEEIKEISDVVSVKDVAGSRAFANSEINTWRYANTPQKESKASS